MTLPDPREFDNALKYLRESHKVLLSALAKLEELIKDAEAIGVEKSFATHGTWAELFDFFSAQVPRHEIDEERSLFAILEAKLPRMGFHAPDAPIHFLLEGHEILGQRTVDLVNYWAAFLDKK